MKKIVFLIILTLILTSFRKTKERNICDKNWELTLNNDENYSIFIIFKSNGEYSLKMFIKKNNSITEVIMGKWIKNRNTITVVFDDTYEMELKIIDVTKTKLVVENEKNETFTYKLKSF